MLDPMSKRLKPNMGFTAEVRLFLVKKFAEQHAVLWGNLSKLTGILVAVNISMFFLTEAVTKKGYLIRNESFCFSLKRVHSGKESCSTRERYVFRSLGCFLMAA
jgi:hypothetical protein